MRYNRGQSVKLLLGHGSRIRSRAVECAKEVRPARELHEYIKYCYAVRTSVAFTYVVLILHASLISVLNEDSENLKIINVRRMDFATSCSRFLTWLKYLGAFLIVCEMDTRHDYIFYGITLYYTLVRAGNRQLRSVAFL